MSLPFQKPKNKSRRSREYLTEAEVNKIISAARNIGRHGNRDAAMILLAFRHGLRVSELISLRWQQVDLKSGLLQVHRLKNGLDSTHPLFGPELRALRKVQRQYPDTQYVFLSERKSPMTASTFAKLLSRAAEMAEVGILVHPHMLRHSTGYKLANDENDTRSIQQYLGHRNIRHTTRYTELSPNKFNKFWPD
jgi:type 1 fimbriae regulatory protein FimB/type 1 fimbriae regulatory protein FimE